MRINGRSEQKSLLPRMGVLVIALVLIGFSVLLQGCRVTAVPPGLTVKVEQVIDGQLLEVGGVEGHPELTEAIVLTGIEAPDLKQQPWGEDARNTLEKWIGGQTVLLESDVEPRKRTGQRLAYVWQGGTLLNEKLVAEGYALAVPQSPNHKYDLRLARAQDRARILGLGIWQPQQPLRQTPTEFRKQSR